MTRRLQFMAMFCAGVLLAGCADFDEAISGDAKPKSSRKSKNSAPPVSSLPPAPPPPPSAATKVVASPAEQSLTEVQSLPPLTAEQTTVDPAKFGYRWPNQQPRNAPPPALKPSGKLGAKNMVNSRSPDLVLDEWISAEPELEGKMVMIDLWSTSCGGCIASIPALNRWHRKYGDRLTIVGVAPEPKERVESVTRGKVDYYLARDERHRFERSIEVTGIPHVLLVDPYGVVRWQGHPMALEGDATLLDELIDRYSLAPGEVISGSTGVASSTGDGAAADGAADPQGWLGAGLRAAEEGRIVDGAKFVAAAIVAGEPSVEVDDYWFWSAALRQPAMSVRWAVSFEYNMPRNFKLGAPPAGVDLNQQLIQTSLKTSETILRRIAEAAIAGKFGPLTQRAQQHAGAEAVIELIEPQDTEELHRQAAQRNCDLLALAVQTVRPTRQGVMQRTIIWKIFEVGSTRALWTSQPLNNVELERAEAAGGSDPRLKLIDAFEKALARSGREPMPEFTPQVVERRAAALVAKPSANPLAALAELQYYRAHKLLPASALPGLYEKLLADPEQAQVLASDDVSARKQVLQQWLP